MAVRRRVMVWALMGTIVSASPLWAQTPQPQGRPVSVQAMNMDISLDGLFAGAHFSDPNHLNLGGHDPSRRGFTLQNLELTIGGVVDPYVRADTHIVYLITKEGKTAVEVEEAYLTTLALPHGLQFIGGQFFTRVGRINSIHPHAWNFADQPVITSRLFGPDGLRNSGLQLSWLARLPVYLEFIGSVQNAGGETAASFLSTPETTIGGRAMTAREVERLEDLLYLARIKSAWSPSETVEVVMGASGLFGPNATGPATRTSIAGLDLYGKWRPVNAEGGWPFVAVQVEGLWRGYEAAKATAGADVLAAETLSDRGVYASGMWGFTRRWVAATRVDYADGNSPADPLRDRRWRFSPNLTFYPSEFSKWRLQYNLDLAEHRGDRALHAVFLQFEFLIGTHGAHQF